MCPNLQLLSVAPLLQLSCRQVAAEFKAAAIFKAANRLGHCPLLGLPVAGSVNLLAGSFTTSVYAGESLDKKLARGGDWAKLSLGERVELARKAAASILTAIQESEKLVRPLAAMQASVLHHVGPAAVGDIWVV